MTDANNLSYGQGWLACQILSDVCSEDSNIVKWYKGLTDERKQELLNNINKDTNNE